MSTNTKFWYYLPLQVPHKILKNRGKWLTLGHWNNGTAGMTMKIFVYLKSSFQIIG